MSLLRLHKKAPAQGAKDRTGRDLNAIASGIIPVWIIPVWYFTN